MTMIDDERLASLLAETASTFDLPADGRAAIIARARGTAADMLATAGAGPEEPDPAYDDGEDRSAGAVNPPARIAPLRRVAGAARRNRLAAVAACIVVLLVGLAIVGVSTRPAARSTSASSRANHAGVPTTTIPTPSAAQNPAVPFKTYGPTNTPAHASQGGAPYAQTQTKSGLAAPSTSSTSNGARPKNAAGRSSRIEQTGTLGLTVGRGAVNRTVAALAALAGANRGYVANSQTQTGAGGAPRGSVTLEVPVDSFAAVLKQAEALGRPTGVSTQATDVTGQYVDLQARISALQSSRQQYLTIMARATTIGDVLSVQDQIDTIQSQIEQLQGQLQVLTSETAYSSLTATVNQSSPPPSPSPVPESGLIQAWHQSLGGFVGGLEGVLRLAGPTLFALLLLAGVVVGGRTLWRRARRHGL